MKSTKVKDRVHDVDRLHIDLIPSLQLDSEGKVIIPPNLFGGFDSKDHTLLPDEWCNARNIRSYWNAINNSKDSTQLYWTDSQSTDQFRDDVVRFIKELSGKGREAAAEEMCKRAKDRNLSVDDNSTWRTPCNEDELMSVFRSNTMKDKFKENAIETLDDYYYCCINLFDYGKFEWALQVVDRFCTEKNSVHKQ